MLTRQLEGTETTVSKDLKIVGRRGPPNDLILETLGPMWSTGPPTNVKERMVTTLGHTKCFERSSNLYKRYLIKCPMDFSIESKGLESRVSDLKSVRMGLQPKHKKRFLFKWPWCFFSMTHKQKTSPLMPPVEEPDARCRANNEGQMKVQRKCFQRQRKPARELL